MKNTINDWGLTYNSDWNRSYVKQAQETRENFSVHVCPKCNIAYEKNLNCIYFHFIHK